MAHLNEDGVKHLLELIKGKLGNIDIAESLQKAIEVIVSKDPRGHGVYRGKKYLLPEEFQNQFGEFTTPAVEIPFYTDSFNIGSISFTSNDGESISLSLSESGSIMTNTPQDDLGFCPGTLNIEILNNDKVVEEVSSDFIINPITLRIEGGEYINSENPSVVGHTDQYIFLNTFDLGYREQEIGRFSGADLPANIDYVEGFFFMNCPLYNISIASGNPRYISTDPDSGSSLDCILDVENKRIVVGAANFQASYYNHAYNNSEEWTLASGTFSRNEYVYNIYIPSYVKHIESSAFYNCPSLSYVAYQGTWDEFQNVCGGDPYVAFQYDEGGHCVQVYTEGDGQYNDLYF